MRALSTVLELTGLVLVAGGVFLLAPWLGVTVGGVGLVALGLALDPPRRRSS